MASQPSERLIVFLVGAVQFVNILDFMMVMPLGPDFAAGLGIPLNHLGLVGGSYTAAAGVSGLIGSLFLDRFDRRKALAVAMAGLVVGTAAGALATGLGTLLAARVLAGIFGGPATSVAMSIIADVVPVQRRGKAMGAVMSAFSVSSVIGVPTGLVLAEHGSWRTPFIAVALMGALVTLGAAFMLPPLRIHLEQRNEGPVTSGWALITRPIIVNSYAMTATIFMANFIIIPNISAYVLQNLHYPREHFETLYLAGGVVSFVALRTGGALVDRMGVLVTGIAGTCAVLVTIYAGFVAQPPLLPVVGIFMAFMLSTGFRNVSYNTLTSRVPMPSERARFMSIQSAVQHFSSAAGAFLSSRMLHENPDGSLGGMPTVAMASLSLGACVPVLMALVERRVRRRDAATALAPPALPHA